MMPKFESLNTNIGVLDSDIQGPNDESGNSQFHNTTIPQSIIQKQDEDSDELLKQASNLDLDKEDTFENISSIVPVVKNY